MGLSGEGMVREKSQKDGDPNGVLFVHQGHGGLVSASWLVNGQRQERQGGEFRLELKSNDNGVVSF